MVADIARVTYDPTRQYRSLIRQQGRVTLEADENEAQTLAAEALRLETIDIIGPTGAIGDGYLPESGTGFGGLRIGKGIFYLGGWRLELDQALDVPLILQAERDLISDRGRNFALALLLTEQSVGAIEDRALREVALGGPDSAARSRLMQSFIRVPMAGETCAEGGHEIETLLAKQGMAIDPDNCQLIYRVNPTLRAGFVPGPPVKDPCTPAAAGGYLGADNQMVRVTVTEYDGVDTGRLLWSWNNASLLYRATASGTTLTLQDLPVDQEHAPQAKQMVEILLIELDLQDGNYIAAQQGYVTSVTSYDFDTYELVLNDLPLDYQNAQAPVFVRLWQRLVEFHSGEAVPLDDVSGITVTITMPEIKISNPAPPASIAGRPFWRFAVRPSTPVKIYPQRYRDAAQPPDGPRQWMTELAVMTAAEGGARLLRDCRVPYPASGECCSLTLDPAKDWIATLKGAIDDPNASTLNVCFMPGIFKVDATIVVGGGRDKTRKSVRMTGAGAGTRIVGAGLEVVFEFDNCVAVGLFDLSVEAGVAGWSNRPATADLQGAVTIRGRGEIDIERVWLRCANADLRAASCLAIYHPAPPANATGPQANVRILNSEFRVGHYQVGVLVVNADRAQIEGNLIFNPPAPLDIPIDKLGDRPHIAFRLRKQLVQAMTLVDTAPPASRNKRARVRKRAAAALAAAPEKKQSATAKTKTAAAAAAPAASRKVAFAGRAHVTASFGKFQLKFQTSDQLTDAWNNALASSGLTEKSTKGAIHKAVRAISHKMVINPKEISAGAEQWLAALLPKLYSTSSQGIVVAGNVANDVRILNNTIDGTLQGIHVGLSNVKQFGRRSGHLSAVRVQIKGNTVNVRLTVADFFDRHGIYVGCVNSAVIADNHLQLTRMAGGRDGQQASQNIDAIKVSGIFGPLMLIERNCMLGFSTGIYTQQNQTPDLQVPALWKAADNYADQANQINAPPFIITDTVP